MSPVVQVAVELGIIFIGTMFLVVLPILYVAERLKAEDDGKPPYPFRWHGQVIRVRHPVHHFTVPVEPDGGQAGVAQLAHMAATGTVPYRCAHPGCTEVKYL